jgi:hypothetical protein
LHYKEAVRAVHRQGLPLNRALKICSNVWYRVLRRLLLKRFSGRINGCGEINLGASYNIRVLRYMHNNNLKKLKSHPIPKYQMAYPHH